MDLYDELFILNEKVEKLELECEKLKDKLEKLKDLHNLDPARRELEGKWFPPKEEE